MYTGNFLTSDKPNKDDCHDRFRDAGNKVCLGNGYTTGLRHENDRKPRRG